MWIDPIAARSTSESMRERERDREVVGQRASSRGGMCERASRVRRVRHFTRRRAHARLSRRAHKRVRRGIKKNKGRGKGEKKTSKAKKQKSAILACRGSWCWRWTVAASNTSSNSGRLYSASTSSEVQSWRTSPSALPDDVVIAAGADAAAAAERWEVTSSRR